MPVLRGLGADGKVLWSHPLPSGPQGSMILGLATADQSALALVGPTRGETAGAELSLIRVDGAGSEGARLPIRLSGDARAGLSGYLAVDKEAGLAAVNRGARPTESPRGYNGFGVPEFCVQGDASDIVLIEVPALRERKRLQIERFRANVALAVKDGWIVVGDGRGDCTRETHAAAYAVGNDGSVAPLWRDASPFNTSGRGIRRSAGSIEIVGYAQRSVAVQEEAPAVTAPDFSAKRLGNETYVAGEVFSVGLSDQGQEERRDFVGAGFPVIPMGMASAGERSAIFGTVGSRPLWIKH